MPKIGKNVPTLNVIDELGGNFTNPDMIEHSLNCSRDLLIY